MHPPTANRTVRHSQRIAAALAAVLMMAPSAQHAGAAPAPGRAATAPRRLPDFPPIKPVFADRVAQVEKEIAQYILQRPDSQPAAIPQLDLHIDLRVVERWLLTQATNAKAESPEQVALVLRAQQFDTALAQFEEAAKSTFAQPLSKTQNEALQRLHQLSFQLVDPKGPQQVDDVCRDVGTAMLGVLNGHPAAAMRPPRNEAEVAAEAVADAQPANDTNVAVPPAAPLTLASLSAEVTRVNVSIPLRNQMLALSKQVAAAAKDPEAAKDAPALFQMLGDAVDLSKGLSSSVGMSNETRTMNNAQLAEGLALFSDPRTRAAGKERVESLNQYRQILVRVGRFSLTAEQRNQFRGAFTYAQNNVERGEKVLDAIEGYLGELSRYAAAPRRETVPANLRAAVAEAARQVETQRDAFAKGAAAMGGPSSSVTPEQLDASVNELRTAVDLYLVLSGLPQVLDSINAYKPRPAGRLEQRVGRQAVLAIGGAGIKPASRTEAMNFLTELTRLARVADILAHEDLNDVPSPVAQTYGGGKLAEFHAHCKQVVSDLASAAAIDKELDRTKVQRLQSFTELTMALRVAARFEQNVDRCASLQRWVDWTISPEQARALTAPYAQALSAAITGLTADSSDGVDRFQKLRAEYLPLMALVNRDAGYAAACDALPSGATSEIVKLLTPLDGQPFATERYASYATQLWTAFGRSDGASADIVAEYLLQRLGRQRRLSDPEFTAPAGKAATRP